jgi:hypothetical protein
MGKERTSVLSIFCNVARASGHERPCGASMQSSAFDDHPLDSSGNFCALQLVATLFLNLRIFRRDLGGSVPSVNPVSGLAMAVPYVQALRGMATAFFPSIAHRR